MIQVQEPAASSIYAHLTASIDPRTLADEVFAAHEVLDVMGIPEIHDGLRLSLDERIMVLGRRCLARRL